MSQPEEPMDVADVGENSVGFIYRTVLNIRVNIQN